MTTATRAPSPISDADFQAAIENAVPDKTNGTPLAAILASGIGTFVMGAMTTGAVISSGLKTALTLDKGVGPLSGKTAVAILAYVLSFAVAYFVMRGKNYAPRPFYIATFVLIALGFLATFPLFFDLFGG